MSKPDIANKLLDDGPQLEVSGVAILMVLITMFIDTLAGSISTPVMPYYAKAFGASTAQVGWLYASWSFSSFMFAPCLTRLADKIGRRPVLILSLLGAGVANVIQGIAVHFGSWGFSVFLFGRFFSGVWAAVGATCNVYITDVTPEELRPTYMAKMGAVPLIALLFGPGLGGGLSKFGLNVPVLVDGSLTIFSAMLVSYYLPETPAFLRRKASSIESAATGAATPAGPTPMPREVYFIGVTQLFNGFGFSTMISTLAIFMMDNYEGFDALHVGFTFMMGAIMMVLSNVWGVPFVKERFSTVTCIIIGGLINGLAVAVFASSTTLWVTLSAFAFGQAGLAIRGAFSTAYTGSFSDVTNRGSIFSTMQVFMNAGRMIGPVVSTHLAQHYGSWSPFVLMALLAFCSAFISLLIDRCHRGSPATTAAASTISRRATDYGPMWRDELGQKEDFESIGKYVGDLLGKRHYKWISKRADIERLLDRVLPELQITSKEDYDMSFVGVETKQF